MPATNASPVAALASRVAAAPPNAPPILWHAARVMSAQPAEVLPSSAAAVAFAMAPLSAVPPMSVHAAAMGSLAVTERRAQLGWSAMPATSSVLKLVAVMGSLAVVA